MSETITLYVLFHGEFCVIWKPESIGDSALQILEGRIEGTIAQGKTRRMWLDDIKSWSKLNTYEIILKELLKTEKNGKPVRGRHVSLLN